MRPRTAATVLLAVPALLAPVLLPGPAGAAARPLDLGIGGRAEHRRAVPDETQTVTWQVRNFGGLPVERVVLDARVPAGWSWYSGSCALIAAGRLRCPLGRLAPGAARTARIVLTVPHRPSFGPARLSAVTRFAANGVDHRGPSAGMRFAVVRHR
ncbi:NEW3 domain-containing protein [Actinomadura parmotrematis]|uniref:Alpha-galactosidase NEW3 domain-containing protein n=1 Tax=Actinomadura parmotrematis TaxID=2864039 RepID=A0ABS7G341_9ACTN|nr:NEW3 domain-containing protein [Actinomadura parmotrematis]MBW8487128.1 hypothetical protein [Actinomadura parmotrematis]